MISTKNVKGNLQIVVATYNCEPVFKIPDGLDLEDENVVSSWGTKYGTLYISYVNSDKELQIELEWEPEIDWKYSSDEVIKDADEHNVEYKEDNAQKCCDCDYTWTTEDFDADKGRIAFSHPCEGIKEGDVVCTMCHVKGFECHECTTWIKRDSEEHDCAFIQHDYANDLPDKILCSGCGLQKWTSNDNDNNEEDKEYRITDIDFDSGKYCEEHLSENYGVDDWNKFNKSLIKETCGKTWFACTEEEICD